MAISDPLGVVARGLEVILRTDLPADLATVRRLVEENGPGRVLVGLPLDMDGGEGEMARRVRGFARRLAEALEGTGAEVLLTDYHQEALDYAEKNWRENVGTAPRSRLLDWREPPDDLEADVVLAADVAYEKRFFQPLADTFQALARSGGRALIAEPGRPLAKAFFPTLARAGFQCERRLVEVQAHGRDHEIGLYTLRKIS